MILYLALSALVTGALSSTCQSYDEKYAEVDWTSNYTTANDPCFGYTTSCCSNTTLTNGCCYWKQTDYCLNTYGRSGCDENDGESCPACCDSTDTASEDKECTPTMAPTMDPVTAPTVPVTPAPTVAVTTDAPTMHSAKKWERLHPDYQGGDGELLWSIYYGAYAEDVRFDAFRANQLWDAAVVRPMIQMDLKAEAADADAEGLSAHWTETTAETTSTCESYDEKYAEVDWNSTQTTKNDPCFGYTTSCCEDTEVTNGCCYWKQTAYCLGTYTSGCDEDDGEDCPACCDSTNSAVEDALCTPTEEPTAAPTTTAPTTPAPVTPAPVTPAPVTPAPVTPAPVTPAPVATPAPTVEVTTKSPTMHSSKKWAMLHPDYQGGDGELLWSIYYGEYSVDQRFDAFRDAQMWDADVIRPMIVDDVEFARFQTVSKSSSSSNVGSHQWMILAAAAMVIVAAFAVWLKQRNSYQKIVDPVETKALLESYGN